eukprot:CAMPEP_0179216188 /NCGR_PEP_ID=MMETSP0797-20121207/3246_1 /TAXON_ID=47934 /ORGANISM="Dinophysis acuminata, Strain DAEP01" /LENGTH=36 /DNA_ID= /DNA_START= /DNA_END= /DNA_ORIENTATION=
MSGTQQDILHSSFVTPGGRWGPAPQKSPRAVSLLSP